MKDFGVYISCYRGDYRLARGTIASVQHFSPGVPICLLADGDFSTADAERLPGVTVMRREDVQNAWLRQNSFGGFGYSHLIPFWEGPFERFLFLDGDIVVLGDLVTRLQAPATDLVVPSKGPMPDESVFAAHWYKCDVMRANFPEFEPTGWPVFCAGTFIGKKGVLDLGIYRRLFELQQRDNSSLLFGDQGILNFIFFYAASQGTATMSYVDYQEFPTLMGPELRALALRMLGGAPSSHADEAMVVHYAGSNKPTIYHEDSAFGVNAFLRKKQIASEVFARPMNHFRRKFAEAAGDGDLWWEDTQVIGKKTWNWVAKKLPKLPLRNS